MLKISADFENRVIYVTDTITNGVTVLNRYRKFTKKNIQTLNFKGVGHIKHHISLDAFSEEDTNTGNALSELDCLRNKQESVSSHYNFYFEQRTNENLKSIADSKASFSLFKNKKIRKIVGTSLSNFTNHLNKLMYKVFVAPIDENTKSKLLFGFGNNISPSRIAEYYRAKEHIDEAMNDGLPNVALLCMFFGKSRKETKELFSKSQWKHIVKLAFSKLKRVVQSTRKIKGHMTEKDVARSIVKLSGCATTLLSMNLEMRDISLDHVVYVSKNFRGMYKNKSEICRRAIIVSDTMRMCERNNIVFNLDWSWNRMQQEHNNVVALENARYLQRRLKRDGFDLNKSFDYIKSLTNVISDDTVTDLTATIIKNGSDLMEHGRQMRHCVGGYYTDCYHNMYVVYSVKHGEINSTLGIWYNSNKSVFELDQHYGNCNSNVSEVVKMFGKKVVDKLNEEIKLDQVKQIFSKK